MKKTNTIYLLGGGLIFALVLIVGILLGSKDNPIAEALGVNQQSSTNYQIMAGTADQFTLMPPVYVNDNSTNTNPTLHGGYINQRVDVDGVSKIALAASGIGKTATSSFNAKLLGSYDGDTWFDIASSTNDGVSATTTLVSNVKAYTYDFGLTTTTKIWSISIPPVKFVRTLFYGENIATDVTDGVKAYITIGKLEE